MLTDQKVYIKIGKIADQQMDVSEAGAGAENGAERDRKGDERERSGSGRSRERERSGEQAESAAHNPLKPNNN